MCFGFLSWRTFVLNFHFFSIQKPFLLKSLSEGSLSLNFSPTQKDNTFHKREYFTHEKDNSFHKWSYTNITRRKNSVLLNLVQCGHSGEKILWRKESDFSHKPHGFVPLSFAVTHGVMVKVHLRKFMILNSNPIRASVSNAKGGKSAIIRPRCLLV